MQTGYHQEQKADPSAGDTRADQRGTPTSPFVVETYPRPDNPDEATKHKAENDAKEYRDAWTFRLTILNAVFTGFVVALTGGLVCVGWHGVRAALRTLRAIEDQGKQADRHLVLVERPWLSPSIQLNGPLTLTGDGGISVPILIEIENLGKSPATAITISPTIWLEGGGNIVDERKHLCNQTEGQCARNLDFGEVLFPGSASQYSIEYNVGASAEDIQRYSRNGTYDAFIILCVAYRSTLDDNKVHHTAPTYHLYRLDPQPPNAPLPFNVGESVQPLGIRLNRWFVGPSIK